MTVLFAFFIVGYFVLAGFDIGVGMMLPLLGGDRRLTLATIAPFFLANEVWLVGSVGLASGSFPGREGAVFGRVLPVIVSLVLGWIVRDMGLWLRGRVDSAPWRAWCDAAIVTGSWTIAVCWGVTIGVLAGGVFTVLVPIAACCAFAAHGVVFATLRLAGPAGALRRRAARLALPVTTLAMVGLPLFGMSFLPAGASAAHNTRMLLIVILVPLLPVLLAAQAWVWWTFRARVERPSYL